MDESIFKFVEFSGLGLDYEQIAYIKELVRYYCDKYSGIILNKVCDFFCWDYPYMRPNMFNYTHNRTGDLYESYDALAKYDPEDKLIGLNQIRLVNASLKAEDAVKRVEGICQQLIELKRKYKIAAIYCKMAGEEVPTYYDMLQEFLGEELSRMEIDIDYMTEDYLDVVLIRCLEESISIQRIIAHEIGHAIDYQYSISADEEIRRLYCQYERGFEDIREFIAECFMASELTDKIPLANKVKERIGEII